MDVLVVIILVVVLRLLEPAVNRLEVIEPALLLHSSSLYTIHELMKVFVALPVIQKFEAEIVALAEISV